MANEAAGLAKAVLHSLIVEAETSGNVGTLQTAVEVETIDAGSDLGQAFEAMLDVAESVVDVDGGLDAIV